MATAIVVGSLLFLLAFVLAGTTQATQGLVRRVEHETRARNLAESAVALGIERIQGDRSFGTRPVPPLKFQLPGDPDGAFGSACFLPGSDQAYSTNNLAGDGAVPGWSGRSVPAHSVHLVGTGTSGGVQRRIEVILQTGAFPYVVASQGPVIANSGVLIGSLEQQGVAGLLKISPEQLDPGSLACNSNQPQSVQLGSQSTVAGDLRSAGGIVLSPQAMVKGQTLSYSQAVTLPQVDLDRYDPQQAAVDFQSLPSVITGQTLVGASRSQGDLYVQGDLTLDGGSLYVPGNLQIQGGIRGTGMVVVRGSTTVARGACLNSVNKAVLLSQGNVKLSGLGADASSFQGLVYTEGSFSAQQISLLGVYIARGADKSTTLDSANVLYQSSSTQLQLGLPSTTLSFSAIVGADGKTRVSYLAARPEDDREDHSDDDHESDDKGHASDDKGCDGSKIQNACSAGARPAADSTFSLRVTVQAGGVQQGGCRSDIYMITDPTTARQVQAVGSSAAMKAVGQMIAERISSSGGMLDPASSFSPQGSVAMQGQEVALYKDMSRAATALPLAGGFYNFDLNEFLGTSAQPHVTLWREVP